MTIVLRYCDDDSERVAEREFDWQEAMGNSFPVSSPATPTDSLMLDVVSNKKERGRVVCEVSAPFDKDDVPFEDILRYGFVEVPR
jgi:hypothetical protein